MKKKTRRTNPVAKHINTFNKPKTFVDRKKELKRKCFQVRDANAVYKTRDGSKKYWVSEDKTIYIN